MWWLLIYLIIAILPTLRTSDFRFSVFISQTCVVPTLSKQFQVNRKKRQVENRILIHNSKSPLSCVNPFVTRVCRKIPKCVKTSAECRILVIVLYYFSVQSRKVYRCPQCGEKVRTEYMNASRCGMCGAPLKQEKTE